MARPGLEPGTPRFSVVPHFPLNQTKCRHFRHYLTIDEQLWRVRSLRAVPLCLGQSTLVWPKRSAELQPVPLGERDDIIERELHRYLRWRNAHRHDPRLQRSEKR